MSWLIGIVVFVVVLIIWANTNTNDGAAIRLLQREQYEDIQITGYRWLTCGGDWKCTGFEATKNGELVTGAVSQGVWGKGQTIRYD